MTAIELEIMPSKIVKLSEYRERLEEVLSQQGRLRTAFTIAGGLLAMAMGGARIVAFRKNWDAFTKAKDSQAEDHRYISPHQMTLTGHFKGGPVYIDDQYEDVVDRIRVGEDGSLTACLAHLARDVSRAAFGACENHVDKLDSGEVVSFRDARENYGPRSIVVVQPNSVPQYGSDGESLQNPMLR